MQICVCFYHAGVAVILSVNAFHCFSVQNSKKDFAQQFSEYFSSQCAFLHVLQGSKREDQGLWNKVDHSRASTVCIFKTQYNTSCRQTLSIRNLSVDDTNIDNLDNGTWRLNAVNRYTLSLRSAQQQTHYWKAFVFQFLFKWKKTWLSLTSWQHFNYQCFSNSCTRHIQG